MKISGPALFSIMSGKEILCREAAGDFRPLFCFLATARVLLIEDLRLTESLFYIFVARFLL